MKSTASILAAPVGCLLLLGGIVAENATHTRPQDAAPYHAAAEVAIKAWPTTIGREWNGASREDQIPAAAMRLLRPNVTLYRTYTSSRTGMLAHLLIVQCRDPNDMSGHYPPNCYPNNGEQLVYQQARELQVGDRKIRFVEYHFADDRSITQSGRKCVYNFFVVPGRGIVPDMATVREASGDYLRRYFGAAQFQVVFPAHMGDVPQQVRDDVFVTLIGANPAAFKALRSNGL